MSRSRAICNDWRGALRRPSGELAEDILRPRVSIRSERATLQFGRCRAETVERLTNTLPLNSLAGWSPDHRGAFFDVTGSADAALF